MRKIICYVVTMAMLVSFSGMAYAFGSASDEIIRKPINDAQVKPAQTTNSFTASGITNAVKKAVKNGVADISKKMEALKVEVNKKDTATSKSVDALGQKIDKQTLEIQSVGKDVKTLDKKLTGKDGEFEKTRDAIGAVDASIAYMAIGIVIAVCLVGLVIVLVLRSSLKRVEKKIDEVPTKVKTLDPFEMVINDIDGRDVIFQVTVVDDMYESLYVPKTISVSASDPKQIVRVKMSDKGKLRRSTREVMTEYFAGMFNGSDLHSVEQKRLIEYLISTGELVVS